MTKETMIIETVSGQLIDLTNINPANVLLSDIVHGLSLVNRFNGRHVQTGEPLNLITKDAWDSAVGRVPNQDAPVTVLQHSYAMYLFARHKYHDNHRLSIECLLHDAPEAYTGDIITPLKKHIPMITDIEHSILNTLANVYKLPLPDSEAVKDIDALALRIEWETFVSQVGRLDRYNERAKHYGERPEDANPMDDVAMRRALFEARSLSRRALADKVLLILNAEIVQGLRDYYLAGSFANKECPKSGPYISCTLYVDKKFKETFVHSPCEGVAVAINNLYVLNSIDNGTVTATGSEWSLRTLQEKLDDDGLYSTELKPIKDAEDNFSLQVFHRFDGDIIRVQEGEPAPNWEDKDTDKGLVSRLLELTTPDVSICAGEHYGFNGIVDANCFARKILLELLDKDTTARYSARTQVLDKKVVVIFYKEAGEYL